MDPQFSIVKKFSEIRKENEQIKVIQNDIDATKKESLKHMEQNESLEQFKQRLSEDSHRMSKQCKCQCLSLAAKHNKSNHSHAKMSFL